MNIMHLYSPKKKNGMTISSTRLFETWLAWATSVVQRQAWLLGHKKKEKRRWRPLRCSSLTRWKNGWLILVVIIVLRPTPWPGSAGLMFQNLFTVVFLMKRVKRIPNVEVAWLVLAIDACLGALNLSLWLSSLQCVRSFVLWSLVEPRTP